MRPYLGTFVEVRVSGLLGLQAVRTIDRAFAQVATVQHLMSAHDDTSDLGGLFRYGASVPVSVHPWTYEVLKASAFLNGLSAGVFDVSVGDSLHFAGDLPHWTSDRLAACACRRRRQPFRNNPLEFDFLDGYRIRLNRSARIDLGGIAKGFAVDRALDVLRQSGASSGCVNAGGDFAVFGRDPEPLVLRHPQNPQQLVHIGQIESGAVATSAAYFSKRPGRHKALSTFIDGRTNKRSIFRGSVSVLAPSCMWADALTKIIAIDRCRGVMLLDRFDARALILKRDKDRLRMETIASHAEPEFLPKNDGRTDLPSRV